MNKIFGSLLGLFLVFNSCQNKETQPVSATSVFSDYEVFGDTVKAQEILSADAMLARYKNLAQGDTISVAFKSTIEEVCQRKGCWMRMNLGEDQGSFVKFTDYSFFVPKNAATHQTIVGGKAFVDVVSVGEQQHYAADAGKSKEEIEAITTPKVTYGFIADGVLIAK